MEKYIERFLNSGVDYGTDEEFELYVAQVAASPDIFVLIIKKYLENVQTNSMAYSIIAILRDALQFAEEMYNIKLDFSEIVPLLKGLACVDFHDISVPLKINSLFEEMGIPS